MDTESSGSPPVRTVRIWGHASEPLCLTPLHPTSPQILMMCTVYIDNFDPIFKILHVPTLKKSILEVSSDISIISKNPSMEAFLFAMYYAAVTTLAPESCTAYFHEEKDCLLDRYRCAAEIALANAELLINGNMVTLQALVVLLVSCSISPLISTLFSSFMRAHFQRSLDISELITLIYSCRFAFAVTMIHRLVFKSFEAVLH